MPPNKDIEQPMVHDNSVVAAKRYHAGSKRSQERLSELKYDPIGELVEQYHQLGEAILSEIRWRDGEEVRLNAKGQPRTYHHDMLDKLLDKRLKIAEALLRYGYGRVPENAPVEEKEVPMFNIVLSKDAVKRLPDG
jgi:hypothetical protein